MSKEDSLSAPPADLADRFDAMVANPRTAYDVLRNSNDVALDTYWVNRRIAYLLELGVASEQDAHSIATGELHTGYLGEIVLSSDLIHRNHEALKKADSSFV